MTLRDEAGCMLGVALTADALHERPEEAARLLALLRELRIPHLVLEDRDQPMSDVLEALAVPPARVYVIGIEEDALVPARAAGMNTLHLDEARGVLAEAYTRSALNLRYLYRTVLDWRPGHFKA